MWLAKDDQTSLIFFRNTSTEVINIFNAAKLLLIQKHYHMLLDLLNNAFNIQQYLFRIFKLNTEHENQHITAHFQCLFYNINTTYHSKRCLVHVYHNF